MKTEQTSEGSQVYRMPDGSTVETEITNGWPSWLIRNSDGVSVVNFAVKTKGPFVVVIKDGKPRNAIAFGIPSFVVKIEDDGEFSTVASMPFC